MRNFINIITEADARTINEARITDGALTSVSSSDLQQLVADQDYRGCGVAGRVYLWKAHDDTHHGFRCRLGLPSFSHAGGGEETDGFNFFCAASNAYYETEQGDDEARDDWVISREDYTVGTAAVWVDAEPNVVLQNRQFARMVGRPVIEPPQG